MNINEIKVITNKITHSHMIDLVDFAVKNSFSSNDGEYHKYLQDYAEGLAILLTFTNYEISEGIKISELFDEVIEITLSDNWKNEIIPELGDVYNRFVEYVDSEIENKMRPMAKFDSTLNSIKSVADQIGDIVNAIGVDKLAQFDFAKFSAALDAIDLNGEETKEVGDNSNIVKLHVDEPKD